MYVAYSDRRKIRERMSEVQVHVQEGEGRGIRPSE